MPELPPVVIPVIDGAPLLAMTAEQASRATGLSVRSLDRLRADPDHPLPAVKLDRRVVFPTVPVMTWLAERAERRSTESA